MAGTVCKAAFAGVGILALMICGCGGTESPDSRTGKLIVLENTQLKKDLEQSREEIKNLERRLEIQKNMLEQCKEERNKFEEQAGTNFASQMDAILGSLSDENAKLKEQNAALQEKLEQLEAKLAELEKKPQE
jgi:chromosome segregation ATPase